MTADMAVTAKDATISGKMPKSGGSSVGYQYQGEGYYGSQRDREEKEADRRFFPLPAFSGLPVFCHTFLSDPS